jgi:hypothetical protein
MFASHGTLSSIHDVVPEVPMKLDCLDRVPFSYRPGFLEAPWTSHIQIPADLPST